MTERRWAISSATLLLVGFGASVWTQSAYPPADRGEVVEWIGQTRVDDPYRWLEDPASDKTRRWVESQQALLKSRLSDTAFYRTNVERRLKELLQYDLYGLPVREEDRIFYTKSIAGGARTELWLADGSGERVLVDLEALFGADSRLGAFVPSRNGGLVALLVRRKQSNWIEARVFDVNENRLLDDRLERLYSFASRVTWEADGRAFFYTAFESVNPSSAATANNARVMRHRLHTSQDSDEPVGGLPARDGWLYSHNLSDDGRWLIVTAKAGSAQVDDIYAGRTGAGAPRVSRLASDAHAAFTFLGAVNDTFYFYTDDRAERGRVIAFAASDSRMGTWREVVPEKADTISARDQTGANALGMFGGHLVLTYLHDGQPYLSVYRLDGQHLRDVKLPIAGAIWGGLSGNQSDPELFYSFMGLAEPGTPYRLRVAGGDPVVFKASKIPGIDIGDFEVRQVFVKSPDGTSVPMFIAHKRGIPLDGKRQTWMYGYGAMGWVSFLYFQPQLLVWLEQGGVYAQPSLRGGGEYGKAWHAAGSGLQEQNSIDDFLASAQWLVDHAYTSPPYLVGQGGSLSGALIGAAINQQPPLFGAALIDRPVLDLLRYDKFTGGGYWAAELGSTSDPASLAVLRRLSPYHNVRAQCYPAVLVMSGDLDQVAVPAHAYKYTAALQHAQTCAKRPILLKVMRGAGHNFGPNPSAIADSYADALTFLKASLATPPEQTRSASPNRSPR